MEGGDASGRKPQVDKGLRVEPTGSGGELVAGNLKRTPAKPNTVVAQGQGPQRLVPLLPDFFYDALDVALHAAARGLAPLADTLQSAPEGRLPRPEYEALHRRISIAGRLQQAHRLR